MEKQAQQSIQDIIKRGNALTQSAYIGYLKAVREELERLIEQAEDAHRAGKIT